MTRGFLHLSISFLFASRWRSSSICPAQTGSGQGRLSHSPHAHSPANPVPRLRPRLCQRPLCVIQKFACYVGSPRLCYEHRPGSLAVTSVPKLIDTYPGWLPPKGWNAMERERILITVRTYPTISKKHIETVCTGGINDKGEWRRLYPVPLRYVEEERQFKTFDVVDLALRQADDGRPESRKPCMETLRITGHIDGWPARCDWVRPTILASMDAMVSSGRTLAPVIVRRILELLADPCEPEWSPGQKELLKQDLLFTKRVPLEKIPFEFRLRWQDGDGKEHSSLVLAWELYQTWRTYRHRYSDPLKVIREKFLCDVFGPARELSLFMGNHSRFRDTWMVCGWFNPPKEQAANGCLFPV